MLLVYQTLSKMTEKQYLHTDYFCLNNMLMTHKSSLNEPFEHLYLLSHITTTILLTLLQTTVEFLNVITK
jgi:hypothetical protein